jgi:putative effector of murein hydrolase
VSALAAQLAVYFAAALSVKPELARSLQPQAVMELQMAMAVDAREGRNDDTPDSEFIRGR